MLEVDVANELSQLAPARSTGVRHTCCDTVAPGGSRMATISQGAVVGTAVSHVALQVGRLWVFGSRLSRYGLMGRATFCVRIGCTQETEK